MSREILVATTFRDFLGKPDDKTQLAFLTSLKKQSYQNYKLIVTNFREKNVENTLELLEMPFEFVQSQKDIWISFTEVIQNTIKYLKPKKHILVWTNSDNILDVNFFETLVDNFSVGVSGTSYPHLTYTSLDNYNLKNTHEWYYGRTGSKFTDYDPNVYVPDLIFIDGDILLDKSNSVLLNKYKMDVFYQGIVSTLMLANFSDKMENYYFLSKIHNIHNLPDSYQVKKSKYTKDDIIKNKLLLKSFCIERDINKAEYTNSVFHHKKLIQHKKYKIVGSGIQKLLFKMYFLYYTIFPRKQFILYKIIKHYSGKLLRKIGIIK